MYQGAPSVHIRIAAALLSLLAAATDLPGDGKELPLFASIEHVVSLGLLLYLGCISLVRPQPAVFSVGWFFCALCGLSLIFFAVATDIPWRPGIFWGGCAASALRVLAFRSRLSGVVRALIPLECIIGLCIITLLLPPNPSFSTAAFFALALAHAALWFLLWKIWSFFSGDTNQQDTLKAANERLRKKLANGTLPYGLEQQVRTTLGLAERLLASPMRLNKRTRGLVEEYREAVGTVSRVGANYGSRRRKAILDELYHLEHSFTHALAGGSACRNEKSLLTEEMTFFSQSSTELWKKSQELPRPMRRHVLGICEATESILHCMKKDSRDVAPGRRFLNRYLKASHAVVDRHIALQGHKAAQKKVGKVLDRSKPVLARLEKAFTDEHEKLLHNDAIDLTAELNTVDTLLAMDKGASRPENSNL